MAVTSVWAIKGRVDNMIRYITNPEKTIDWEEAEVFHRIDNVVQYSADELKTEELAYVSYINCNDLLAENIVETSLGKTSL